MPRPDTPVAADVDIPGPSDPAPEADVPAREDISPGEVPPDDGNDEGDEDAGPCEKPAPFLCPCEADEDCRSASCVPTADGKVCTRLCLSDCPDGWVCTQVRTSPEIAFECIPAHPALCHPCRSSVDCRGGFTGEGDLCVSHGPAGEGFCGSACVGDTDCPAGYRCAVAPLVEGGSSLQCARADGAECPCTAASEGLVTGCEIANDAGRCRGTRTCSGNRLGPCDAPTPTAETCNGRDDDCNGATDDGLAAQATACPMQQGVCTGARAQCRGALLWACDAATYQAWDPRYVEAETDCDGQDNDCDGLTDEGWMATSTACGQGTCGGAGLLTCTGGRPVDTCLPRDCDDGNPCNGFETCDPVAGCEPGTPPACDDGDRCNGFESCDTGTGLCAAGRPVACVAKDRCHLAGRCDPATGVCDQPAAPDGTVCDDGDPGTGGDRCLHGMCVGEGCNCAGQGPCCDGCLARNAGGECSDGDACTGGETCAFGACGGGVPRVCDAVDQCHVPGSCDPVTGLCTNPAMPEGTSCDDGNACTGIDACRAGVCIGSRSVVCVPQDACHEDGLCDPATGACSNPLAPDGTACTDRNECTRTDTCRGGLCAGEDLVACGSQDPCHLAGVCNAATGLCSNPVGVEGTSCDDGDPCTRTDACTSGVCVGHDAVVCRPVDGCHLAGTCDPATGLCSSPVATDGSACSDGSACTRTDTCSGGRCLGSNPVTCTALDACHEAGTCVPATGLCTNPPGPDGLPCDDGNACTRSDACLDGRCTGSDPVACAPLDFCHTIGVCDPATGRCTDPVRGDGAACDDGNACTRTDACRDGACIGSDPVVCTPLDSCHVDGECDPAVGFCSQPRKDEGAACDDGDPCTVPDRCTGLPADGFACRGVPYSCDDGLACTLDACDGQGGCNRFVGDGYCLIDGACHGDGAPDPGHPCRTCSTADSAFSWTSLADGTPCGYLEECTAGECVSTECAPGFKVIPPGEFDMGSPLAELGRGDGETQHRVVFIRDLCVKTTEVTQDEWTSLMGSNPSSDPACGGDCAVETVSYWDALAYCNALSLQQVLSPCYGLNMCTGTPGSATSPYRCASIAYYGPKCGYRLPTESEWEYAARAGVDRATYNGDLDAAHLQCEAPNDVLDPVAWYQGNTCEAAPDASCQGGANCQGRPVGGKAPNGIGLQDLLGNVGEWVWDRFGTYPEGPITDPAGVTTGTLRVWRGGAWASPAVECRAAWRGSADPSLRTGSIGFRPVKSLPVVSTCGNPTPLGDPCDDGNACTKDDRCRAGTGERMVCEGTRYYCSDAYWCTEDTCDGRGNCLFPLSPETCQINGTCYAAGTMNGPCRECDPDDGSATAWTVWPDGTPCGTASVCVDAYCVPTGCPIFDIADLRVPAGQFSMGSPPEEPGRLADETQHTVDLTRDYCISSRELMQFQWLSYTSRNPSMFPTCGTHCPMDNLSWWDAIAYANGTSSKKGLPACYLVSGCTGDPGSTTTPYSCASVTSVGPSCLGYRLPTEAEWEYAARAGTGTATYNGDLGAADLDCEEPNAVLDPIAWFLGNSCDVPPDPSCEGASGCRPHLTGGLAANAWKLRDALGNVAEWTSDWYGVYSADPVADPTGSATGTERVIRGGSFASPACRAAARQSASPDFRDGTVGFRLVRTLP